MVRSNSSKKLLVQIFALAISVTTLAQGIAVHVSPQTAQAAESNVAWSGPRVYFPGTGLALAGLFLQRWAVENHPLGMGHPVTPVIADGGGIVQWTEFGKYELQRPDIESASLDDVIRVKIGLEYAHHVGYSRWLEAFRPTDAADTQSRYFYETRHTLANDFLRIYERRGNAERLGAPISEEFSVADKNYQFFEYGALSWDAVNGTQFIPLGRLDAALKGLGDHEDDYTPGDIYYSSVNMLQISDAFPGNRWIEIDLSSHEMIAWVGDTELMRTDAVTGPPQSPTPTGNFSIYLKHRIQDLSGIGWSGQPFSAPGTPWVMYFYLDFGIHGSTWRSTYGYGSGQGCVIPPNEAAEALWKWADYGTRVWVHY